MLDSMIVLNIDDGFDDGGQQKKKKRRRNKYNNNNKRSAIVGEGLEEKDMCSLVTIVG